MNEKMKDIVNIEIEGDLLIGRCFKEMIIDIDVAKELVRIRKETQTLFPQDIIFHFKNIKRITYEAKLYLMSEGTEGVRKGAFVAENLVEEAMFNTFMIKGLHVPTAMFKTIEEAKEWLKS